MEHHTSVSNIKLSLCVCLFNSKLKRYMSPQSTLETVRTAENEITPFCVMHDSLHHSRAAGSYLCSSTREADTCRLPCELYPVSAQASLSYTVRPISNKTKQKHLSLQPPLALLLGNLWSSL